MTRTNPTCPVDQPARAVCCERDGSDCRWVSSREKLIVFSDVLRRTALAKIDAGGCGPRWGLGRDEAVRTISASARSGVRDPASHPGCPAARDTIRTLFLGPAPDVRAVFEQFVDGR